MIGVSVATLRNWEQVPTALVRDILLRILGMKQRQRIRNTHKLLLQTLGANVDTYAQVSTLPHKLAQPTPPRLRASA